MAAGSYFLVSYAHQDSEVVDRVVRDLNKAGIQTWQDTKQLHYGDNWQDAIAKGLEGADGIIVFISQNSIQSKWVMRELQASLRSQRRIFPVMLEYVPDLPPALREIRRLNLQEPANYEAELNLLIETLRSIETSETPASLHSLNIKEVTATIAQEAQQNVDISSIVQRPIDTVFVVHGHDEAFLEEVCEYLRTINIILIVLSRESNESPYLLDKFLANQARAHFAIVLISSDDYGAALRAYYETNDEGKHIKEQALRFRARQNVILELGFFIGRLGSEQVVILQKESDKRYPEFERPSDLDGRLFESFDKKGEWKNVLKKRIEKASSRSVSNS